MEIINEVMKYLKANLKSVILFIVGMLVILFLAILGWNLFIQFVS